MFEFFLLQFARAIFAWIPLSLILGNFRFLFLNFLIVLSFYSSKKSLQEEIIFGLFFGLSLLILFQIFKSLCDAAEFVIFDTNLIFLESGTSLLNKLCLLLLLTNQNTLNFISIYTSSQINFIYFVEIIKTFLFNILFSKLLIISFFISAIGVFITNISLNSELVFTRFLIFAIWFFL